MTTVASAGPTTHRRRRAGAAAAAGVVLALGLGLGVPAVAAPAPAATVPASVDGSVVTAIGTLTFSGADLTTSPGRASGSFYVDGDIVPVSVPGLGIANTLGTFTFRGPITCLDVQGDRAGLIYPISQATGPVGSHFQGQAIYITLQAAAPGQPESVGFVGPAPLGSLTTCPPLAPFLTVQSGHFTVTPAH